MNSSTLTKILGGVLALALVVGLGLVFWPKDEQKHLTADFPRAVSLYDGSDVRILGVKVGKVDSVTPAGTTVIVRMSYDAKYKVPNDAKAVLVSPSIVGDRFIQLTPAYTRGAVMADNTRLGEKRTATPLELDQIYSSINGLTKALGPDGANSPDGSGEGALTRILDSTSRNFDGQGVQANATIKNLGRLTKTLDDNKDNLFGTARELEKFVSTLKANDGTVRNFNDSLAQGADLLAGERQDLAAALRNLATALVDVRQFVQDNKSLLTKNITGLKDVTNILVKRRGQLEQILQYAPAALNNLGLAYNPKTGDLDTRTNIGEDITQLVEQPGTVLCSILAGNTNVPGIPLNQCQGALGQLGLKRTGALDGPRLSAPADRNQYVDRSLGGLVAVSGR